MMLRDLTKKSYVKLTFLLIFLILMAKGVVLIFPDLNLSYPYMAPDSYDWIANGLYYTGFDVHFTLLRPPGLPIVIALLEKIKLLPFLPLLNQLILFGILLTTYQILTRFFSKKVSTITTIILFVNFFLQNLSLFILCDIYALFFISIGFYYYLKSEDNENYYIYSSLFWSISFLFQYAIASVAPAVLVHFFLFRKKISHKTTATSAIFPLLFIGGWYIFKRIYVNNISQQGIDYVHLIKIHLDSIFFYFINIISVLGIFAFIFLVLGVLNELSDWYRHAISKKRLEFSILNILAIASWFVFWVLLYDWNDRRFIAYSIPFIVPFIAIVIELLLNRFKKGNSFVRILVVILILLSIIWSAMAYESVFSFNMLRLTNKFTLQFDAYFDPSSVKGNINALSLQLVDNYNGFNPINILELYKKGKIKSSANTNLINQLVVASNGIKRLKINSLCATYPIDTDKSSWYADKNKFGNYFKDTVKLFPKECSSPNLFIGYGTIEVR